MPEFTLINSENYSVGTLVSVYRLLFDVFCDYSFRSNQLDALTNLPKRMKDALNQSSLSTNNCRLYTKSRLKTKSASTPQQKALVEMVKQVQNGNSHQALTAFACTLLIQLEQKQQSPKIQMVTMALIHLVNILRSYVVMSGVGLTHFVDFFQSDIRKFNDDSNDKEALRWLLAGNNKTSLKVAPPTGDMDWLAQTANQVAQITKQPEALDQHFHYCLHFVRDYYGGLKVGMDDRKRHQVQGQAYQLRRLLKSQTSHRLGLKKDRLRTQYKGISKIKVPTLVQGFDVAGNENHFPVHVFAPALRYLREKSLAVKQLNGKLQLSKKRYLSIHAGEDYNHLITGLRHIDETVRYCNMTQGDRLGHALALGVMPEHWAERQQQAFVTPEEDLFNTVWLLHYATELSVEHSEALQMVVHFEQRLQKWQKRHFKQVYSAETLWAYWQSRGNSGKYEKWTNKSKTLHDRQYWVLFDDGV